MKERGTTLIHSKDYLESLTRIYVLFYLSSNKMLQSYLLILFFPISTNHRVSLKNKYYTPLLPCIYKKLVIVYHNFLFLQTIISILLLLLDNQYGNCDKSHHHLMHNYKYGKSNNPFVRVKNQYLYHLILN